MTTPNPQNLTPRGGLFHADLGGRLTLYRRNGFTEGPPFAGYRPNAFSRFFHLDL
ncbi:MAG: hypothetical protein KDF64_15590 [Geminicoccaceae bacterium]|nr:hypothetical protein [Geminicoccaceae bacterium]